MTISGPNRGKVMMLAVFRADHCARDPWRRYETRSTCRIPRYRSGAAPGELYATIAAQKLTPTGQASGIFASELFTHDEARPSTYHALSSSDPADELPRSRCPQSSSPSSPTPRARIGDSPRSFRFGRPTRPGTDRAEPAAAHRRSPPDRPPRRGPLRRGPPRRLRFIIVGQSWGSADQPGNGWSERVVLRAGRRGVLAR